MNGPEPSWLDGFLSRSRFELFFASLASQHGGFDVLRLPGDMWPNLYLLSVGEDGSLSVVVAGDNLSATFSKGLKGCDLTSFMHGPQSSHVIDAYRRCVSDRVCICMRKQVHLQDKGLARLVEGAIAPLIENGQVRKIVGCLYLYELNDKDGSSLGDIYRARPCAADAV